MAERLVSMRGLSCHFPAAEAGVKLAAVDAVDLDIYTGEILGLVGESGSGKSTLGRMLAGLQQPSAGTLHFHGESEARRARISPVQMVFQDSYASLNPRRRIIDSLMEPLGVARVSTRDKLSKAAKWLERVGLSRDAGERFPHELSGGQRQRVGIARAFIAEPRLVVCDEAVSALDVSVQAQIINLLQDIQRDSGTAIVFIAHDLAVVRSLADRTAVMYLGEIVELGSSAQVFSRPLHPYTRNLLAAHPEAELNSEGRHRRKVAPAQERRLPLSNDSGCRYAPRCSLAKPFCLRTPPALAVSEAGSEVACHRLREIEQYLASRAAKAHDDESSIL